MFLKGTSAAQKKYLAGLGLTNKINCVFVFSDDLPLFTQLIIKTRHE